MCRVPGLLRRNYALDADIICWFPACAVQRAYGCMYDVLNHFVIITLENKTMAICFGAQAVFDKVLLMVWYSMINVNLYSALSPSL